MSHKPSRLDVIADLRRSISASFSKYEFDDPNVKTFLQKAETNLKKIGLDKKTYSLAVGRLNKAKNPKQSIEKRREDILMASSLI
jgi:hypothetical protein